MSSGVQRFNGMLVGRLVSKDVEKGTFVAKIDRVSRVWRNSKAENPKSVVGKTVLVDGVFGRFLDVLVVTRKGETLEFECKHDGDKLTFPGELLRRVAPYDASDYPELPEAFRGMLFGIEPLQGQVVQSEVTPNGTSFATKDVGRSALHDRLDLLAAERRDEVSVIRLEQSDQHDVVFASPVVTNRL